MWRPALYEPRGQGALNSEQSHFGVSWRAGYAAFGDMRGGQPEVGVEKALGFLVCDSDTMLDKFRDCLRRHTGRH